MSVLAGQGGANDRGSKNLQIGMVGVFRSEVNMIESI